MQNFEVEIKSLLGSPERADEVRQAMKEADPASVLVTTNRQLNHYFEGGTLDSLFEKVAPHMLPEAREKLADFAKKAESFSVRTRDKDGTVLLVVKATLGYDSSENGVARMELEEKMPLSLEELDKLVLASGFSYQAKWSREREEYSCNGVAVTLDKNAGYGWLAEFEKVVDDPSKVADATAEITALMDTLGVEELPQDRLERMFSFYNANWQEYYGTDKIFVVE